MVNDIVNQDPDNFDVGDELCNDEKEDAIIKGPVTLKAMADYINEVDDPFVRDDLAIKIFRLMDKLHFASCVMLDTGLEPRGFSDETEEKVIATLMYTMINFAASMKYPDAASMLAKIFDLVNQEPVRAYDLLVKSNPSGNTIMRESTMNYIKGENTNDERI